MIRRPPRSTQSRSSAASDVYKRQAMFLGTNWQLLFAPSPSLAAGVNEQWNSAISQVRSSYNGKIWMGWAFTCDTWPPFDSWSKVDGIHSGDRLKGCLLYTSPS